MAAFYNQATLSYSGRTVNSNVTTGEIVAVLSATKTAVTGEYTQGSETVYLVNIVNSGSEPFAGLTLTDDLGAYTFNETTLTPLDYVEGSVKYFVNGALQAEPAVTAGPPLTVTGISVPAGGTATVVYAATANGFAPLDGTITNTATVSGADVADVTASETTTASTGPELAITKSVSPQTVAENSEVTYTFVISNTGGAEAGAAENLTVTDTFDPVLTDIVVTYTGTARTVTTDYTYDETTGEFATAPGSVTVPAATFAQDPATGMWSVDPGCVTITVTGKL
ncbi:MAG: hypothetical protein IJR90_02690 [Clostridia bacterium]|nr:hypothetical protein [Clostridia bacterium]